MLVFEGMVKTLTPLPVILLYEELFEILLYHAE
jgi:hypothetical protein